MADYKQVTFEWICVAWTVNSVKPRLVDIVYFP